MPRIVRHNELLHVLLWRNVASIFCFFRLSNYEASIIFFEHREYFCGVKFLETKSKTKTRSIVRSFLESVVKPLASSLVNVLIIHRLITFHWATIFRAPGSQHPFPRTQRRSHRRCKILADRIARRRWNEKLHRRRGNDVETLWLRSDEISYEITYEHYLNCRPGSCSADSPRARSKGRGRKTIDVPIYRTSIERFDRWQDQARTITVTRFNYPTASSAIVSHREKWHRTTDLTVCQLCKLRQSSCFRRWRQQCLVSTIVTHGALLPIIKIGIRLGRFDRSVTRVA